MKSARELIEESLEENAFSATGSRTPGSRTNPILAGYMKSAPELMSSFIGSRMNEIEAFAQFHGYDRNMLREIAEEALQSGRVPDLTKRVPDTYDKATIARFISDVMLGIGEDIKKLGPVLVEQQTAEDAFEDLFETYGMGDFVSKPSIDEERAPLEEDTGPLSGLTGLGLRHNMERNRLTELRLAEINERPGERMGRSIYIQPNHLYFMNQNGHDHMVLVTEVRKNEIRYYNGSFKAENRMNLQEARDRLLRGTANFLLTNESCCHPTLSESFELMLSNRRSPLRHTLDECRSITVTVKNSGASKKKDLYHDASVYGAVEELDEGYRIKLPRRRFKQLCRSKLFEVKSVREPLAGLGCLLGEERDFYEKTLEESFDEKPESTSDDKPFRGMSGGVLAEAINVNWQNSFGPNKDYEELDPVGKEDGDVDNDGDEDSSDEYLKNRRKKIKKAIKDRPVGEALWTKGKTDHAGAKKGKGFHGTKKEAKKASKKGRRLQDKKAVQEAFEVSREKGQVVKQYVIEKAREFAVKASANKDNWVYGEDGAEDLNRSRELMSAARQSSDWWAHHYHQYLHCCPAGVVNSLGESVEVVSADENGESMNEEMNYHHVRVSDPDGYDRIRTVTFGKGIKARIGFTKGESSKPVSLMFPKDKYSHSEAKSWAKKHAFKIVKSMKAEGEEWESYESGTLVEAYKNKLPAKVIAVKENLAKLEWTDGYDGPDIVHLSRLRLAGKSSKHALPQPKVPQVEERLEPEDPFLDTLMEHPCYGGNSFEEAMGIMDHVPDNNIKSPLFEMEERAVFSADQGIKPAQSHASDDMWGTIQREDEFFTEGSDPNNNFNSSFWGAEDMRDTLKG